MFVCRCAAPASSAGGAALSELSCRAGPSAPLHPAGRSDFFLQGPTSLGPQLKLNPPGSLFYRIFSIEFFRWSLKITIRVYEVAPSRLESIGS